MAEIVHLSRAPITEAVIDVRTQISSDILAELFANQAEETGYPKSTEINRYRFGVRKDGGREPETLMPNAIFRQIRQPQLSPTPITGSISSFAQQCVEKIQSFENERAFNELMDVFAECRKPNWDGYDAMEVTREAYNQTACFLAEALRLFPAPSPCATPAGSMTLEWMVTNNIRFMVSFDGGDVIAFAGIDGS